MGKKWDYDVPSEDVWRECLRVLKPGGHLLAFAGTRTQHRMAVRIEDAGFEIRDMIAWVYGSGFPKSLNIGKAIDKLQGNEREDLEPTGRYKYQFKDNTGKFVNCRDAEEENKKNVGLTRGTSEWEGWGTALKPALEPITVARKPLGEKTVAANVLEHGTGAINVDACRVGTEATVTVRNGNSGAHGRYGKDDRVFSRENPPGRWPANLIHDGSEEVVGLFPNAKGAAIGTKYRGPKFDGDVYNASTTPQIEFGYGDSGSAARFFYCAKASKKDRNSGCEGFEPKMPRCMGTGDNAVGEGRGSRSTPRANHHPTVKPTDLMRYLCRLVTPPEGIVLDPFMGSGSTGKAAMLEGFNFIGIERDPEYHKIAEARIKAVEPKLI
jgi:site-specific DNA-methyltransferase (adenine-specific)